MSEHGIPSENQQLQDALNELEKSMESAGTSDSTSLAGQVAVDQMMDEFRSVLVSISPLKHNSPSNPSSIQTDSGLSSYSYEWMDNDNPTPKEIHHLRGIANQMVAAGYSEECIEVYVTVRKTVVDERFVKVVRIERLSSTDIRRLEWKVQQEKIKLWIAGARACVHDLFAGERTLCEEIFEGLGNNNMDDDCFIKTVKNSAIQFFNFVQAISTSRKSPEKLFQILDLYQGLSGLLPDIETTFGSKSGNFIRKQAVETLSNLSETARGILSEFGKAVFGEITKFPIPEGSVHPLTKYVMKYIHDMMEHEQTLTQLIVSKPSSLDSICPSNLDFDFSEFEGKSSPLMLHLVWIIVALKFNLQGKSKPYKPTPLAHSFLTNNVDYIVQEIKASVSLRQMIGDDDQNKLINLAEARYQQLTRKSLLDCFICSCFRKVKSFSYGVYGHSI